MTRMTEKEQYLTAILLSADSAEELVEEVNERLKRDGFTNLAAAYAADGKHYAILEVQGGPPKEPRQFETSRRWKL